MTSYQVMKEHRMLKDKRTLKKQKKVRGLCGLEKLERGID